MNEPA